jgi:polar amino acid transport system permease protein
MHFDMRTLVQSFPVLMQGLEMTIWLVLVSTVLGVAIGAIACAGRMLGRGLLYRMSVLYIGLFRALPETVLMFWLYYCGPLVLNVKPSGFETAAATLAIICGASLAEIFRSGIEAVPRGQLEAGRALGLSGWWVGWSVILPQAIRIMLPSFFNYLTIIIKNSALVSAIGVGEIFYQANVFAGQSLRYFEVFSAIGIIYFLLIFPLSVLSQMLERRLAGKHR